MSSNLLQLSSELCVLTFVLCIIVSVPIMIMLLEKILDEGASQLTFTQFLSIARPKNQFFAHNFFPSENRVKSPLTRDRNMMFLVEISYSTTFYDV